MIGKDTLAVPQLKGPQQQRRLQMNPHLTPIFPSTGFVAYLGFLHVLVAHRHPVVLMFCQLLIESNKGTTSEEKRKQLLRN